MKNQQITQSANAPSIIGSWNVVSMVYDITEGVYNSGSYPNGSFTVTNLNSGVSNYALWMPN